ncbi:MAG: DoxX family protein [Pseudopedobacter saltans]|uniref:DoxX family protein n=1 Tax=Pseudopedobacter saltans TaxID=151895 RepID=A0A2W5F4W0_9SPHI|nr:MAG: DoxX family protein [Pseudopedobacter saltans]
MVYILKCLVMNSKKLNTGSFPILNQDFALLVLRIWAGLSLFVKHGIEKFMDFPGMLKHFPDPIHIGATPSLIFALISDAICSILIAIGLFTRIAAAFEIINLFVIFLLLHSFSFMQEHAEIVYLYLGIYLTIFLSGPGKYSLDKR